jgi:hypothetical protein
MIRLYNVLIALRVMNSITRSVMSTAFLFALLCGRPPLVRAAEKAVPEKPKSRTVRRIEGWAVRVDDRLLHGPNERLGGRALKALEAKLADINAVVQPDKLEKLHAVTIVLDLSHGKLQSMQYHPDVDWLVENGYDRDLAQCVHIPRAVELIEPRQINVQPWCVLHELAHAYHDQVLGFDEVRIRDAYTRFKKSGHGDHALLITGERVRHYGLTDQKEFFAEMTESYFGTNDFFPFNRGELMTAEPEIFRLMLEIWGPVQTEQSHRRRERPQSADAAAIPILAPGSSATILWYAEPAQNWDEALPVGNGRLGALVFGGPERERIALNEQTIWTGGPYDPSRTGGPEALPEIRRLVLAGKYFDAEELFGRTMLGKPADQAKYQPLGNLFLDFAGHYPATDYRRRLDLDAATATVSYRVGDVIYGREVFSSPVDQVVVVRLTADKPGSISLVAKIDGVINTKNPGGERHSTKSAAPGQLTLSGTTGKFVDVPGQVRYEAQVRVLNEGGKLTAEKDAARVENADAVTMLITAATNFKRYDDLSGDPAARVRDVLDRAQDKAFDRLRADHVAEHQRLFKRVRLTLPETAASTRATDVRLRDYDPRKDPQLPALMFQYGRYLLLCSWTWTLPGTASSRRTSTWK